MKNYVKVLGPNQLPDFYFFEDTNPIERDRALVHAITNKSDEKKIVSVWKRPAFSGWDDIRQVGENVGFRTYMKKHFAEN